MNTDAYSTKANRAEFKQFALAGTSGGFAACDKLRTFQARKPIMTEGKLAVLKKILENRMKHLDAMGDYLEMFPYSACVPKDRDKLEADTLDIQRQIDELENRP